MSELSESELIELSELGGLGGLSEMNERVNESVYESVALPSRCRFFASACFAWFCLPADVLLLGGGI